MNKRQKLIPLNKLNLTDRFLFEEVMEDPLAHQEALGIILGRDVPLLTLNEAEKELRISPEARSVRLDIFSMDEDRAVYNTEMQKQRRADLSKRSRYYQSLVDISLLDPGIPDYSRLNESYLIMITPFDLFGCGKYRYTFRAECEEEPGCVLEDGATRIFLNTRGTNDAEVSEELAEFLHYVEHTTDEAAEHAGSERIRRIHDRVRKVRNSEEVGVKYMQAWEEKYYEKEEARKEGLQEGLQEGRAKGRAEGRKEERIDLVKKKLEKGKSVLEIADALEETEETIRELMKELGV
ncbi:Rpn family recombination-promoting nuclease/putative transposase [Extibacter muris]|uniref:Rpn family recombination-promoting nuclease/putative transposase n=1 Tax=Extibacter muris TaxID=1796622 RepID=UPI001D0710CB|nr:Rpn family recombination-promoting nuclease/putative transposase [Extibacter muris]MCB6202266.1 Rpn family recombination-promoting nuclease/putative transposase [Extibacter muris]